MQRQPLIMSQMALLQTLITTVYSMQVMNGLAFPSYSKVILSSTLIKLIWILY